jgi:2',3'-cyclic-nucleotide 2'-phosphodiesterase
MRIMFIGDVVGKPGRNAIAEFVPRLKTQHRADFVIVNAENSAGGLGITRDIALAMYNGCKVDVITLGNHAWSKRESHTYLDEELRILRPANYPPGVPGRGLGIFQTPKGPIAVIVLQGRTFMDPTDDPFRMANDLLEEAKRSAKAVFIDFHGEATSEKQAFGWHVSGKASAVVGTHTHVQTADERILPGGTAYLTDVGMTGPIDSVIGMKKEVVLPRFTTLLPSRFEVAEGPARLCGVLIDIDMETGRATAVERIQECQQSAHRAPMLDDFEEAMEEKR